VRRLVLRSELTGDTLDLEPHLGQSGGSDPDAAAALEALKAAHASLEAELAALRSEREASGGESSGAAPANIARERELKVLVQQFTRDSREMLTCIQALESENQSLRATLGGTAKSAA
jgi:predicted  nucleic acid-binding Zn-ribbon protein